MNKNNLKSLITGKVSHNIFGIVLLATVIFWLIFIYNFAIKGPDVNPLITNETNIELDYSAFNQVIEYFDYINQAEIFDPAAMYLNPEIFQEY